MQVDEWAFKIKMNCMRIRLLGRLCVSDVIVQQIGGGREWGGRDVLANDVVKC
jgi:hypothetical protein